MKSETKSQLGPRTSRPRAVVGVSETHGGRHAVEVGEETGDAVITVSREGRLTFMNPAFEAIAGRFRRERLNRPFVLLFEPWDRPKVTRAFLCVLRGESPQALKVKLTRRHGDPVLMALTIVPRVVRGTAKEVVIIARDPRESRCLDDRLRTIQKLDSIGRVAAGLAHDFNNYLNLQQGYASLLLEDPNFPREFLEPVRRIADAGERAAALTRQLLRYGREQNLPEERLDLNALLRASARLLERVAGVGIEIRIECDPRLPEVRGDRGTLEQVILNLMVNACDAMPDGGTVRVDTAVVRGETGDHVCLRVADTGKGIPRDLHHRIFEPFFTTKTRSGGSGLGLAAVQGIVRRHGGWIELESDVGKGATFAVHLPPADAERPGSG